MTINLLQERRRALDKRIRTYGLPPDPTDISPLALRLCGKYRSAIDSTLRKYDAALGDLRERDIEAKFRIIRLYHLARIAVVLFTIGLILYYYVL